MRKVITALAALASSSGVSNEREAFMQLVEKEIERLEGQLQKRGVGMVFARGSLEVCVWGGGSAAAAGSRRQRSGHRAAAASPKPLATAITSLPSAGGAPEGAGCSGGGQAAGGPHRCAPRRMPGSTGAPAHITRGLPAPAPATRVGVPAHAHPRAHPPPPVSQAASWRAWSESWTTRTARLAGACTCWTWMATAWCAGVLCVWLGGWVGGGGGGGGAPPRPQRAEQPPRPKNECPRHHPCRSPLTRSRLP